MKRQIRIFLKRALLYAYRAMRRLCGLHVVPVHYYCPLPDPIELEKTQKSWMRPSKMRGVEVDLESQVKNFRQICLPFVGEYAGNAVYKYASSMGFGPGYGYIEAQALHAMVRYLKPRRIIEVGSGVSTFCMREAARRNEENGGERVEITAIEPNPSPALRAMAGIRLLAQRVQDTG